METPNTVEQTGTETTPSQATEAPVENKPIQREEEAIGAVFSKFDESQAKESPQETPERKEEVKDAPTNGQQAEAPAHWSEEDKALFRSQPKDVQDFLLKRNKALESDYGRKTQQLAEQKRRLEALSFMEQKMSQDASFREHVLSYSQKENQQSKPAENKPPDDPIEQIIWQAEQNVLNRLKEQEEQKAALSHKERIAKTAEQVQADPDFEVVQQGILSFINVLPESVRPLMYQHLDSNPDAYLGTYQMVKQAISERSGQPKTQQQTQVTPTPQTTPQRKETVHKPLIEQSGQVAETNTESKRFKDIKRRASEGDLHAIGAMFDFK